MLEGLLPKHDEVIRFRDLIVFVKDHLNRRYGIDASKIKDSLYRVSQETFESGIRKERSAIQFNVLWIRENEDKSLEGVYRNSPIANR